MALSAGATVAARIFARVAQLLFIVVAARFFTVDEFAAYSYLVVLAVMIALFADTGASLAAGREVAEGRRSPKEAFWFALPIIGVGALVAASLVLIVMSVDNGPPVSGLAIILTATFVAANAAFNYTASLLRSEGRQFTEAVLQAGGALAFVVGGGILAALGAGLVAIVAILAAKEVACFLLGVVALRPGWDRPGRGHAKLLPMVRMSLGLSVSSTALAIVSRSPLVILANSSSEREVAWLSAPLRIADAILMGAMTVGFAVLPMLGHLSQSDRSEAIRVCRRLVLASLALGVLGAAVSVLLAGPAVTTLFGSKFAPAVPDARVLFAAIPGYAVLGVVWYALLAFRGDRELRLTMLGIACVALVAAVVLIPRYGDLGAAATYALSLSAAAAILACHLVRATRRRGFS